MKSALQGKATLQDIHPRIATRPTELLRAIRRKRQADIKSHKEARSAQDPAGGAASSSSSASARKESLRAPERTPEGVFSAISPMALPNKLMTEVDELQEARREYQKNYAEVGELETKTREYEVPEHLQIRGCRWFGLWLLDKLPPQDFATVERGEEVYKGWLYVYEDCIRLDSMPEWRTWQLRYFTISEHGLYSYDHPSEPCTGPHVQFVDLTTATEVAVYDQAKCVFAIRFHNEVLSDLQFRAANEDIMREMMQHISREIKRQEKRSEIEKAIYADAMKDLLWREIEEGEPGYHEHSLLEAPRGRYAFLWHIIVFPMKLAFHYTLVDCRTEGHRKYYGLIIALCTMYLGLMSYLMIFCCENIGDFLGTTPTVMGLTLSAIGTSFPNMWSSMVVARQGYGNMAISNALGSNIFNLDIALGLPWVVLLIVRDGEAYEEMKDHGIVLFILLLEIVCIIWICMIGFSGFTMRVWMAPVFLLLYVVVLTLCLTLG
jgi:Ca2+/Na+ antiporter